MLASGAVSSSFSLTELEPLTREFSVRGVNADLTQMLNPKIDVFRPRIWGPNVCSSRTKTGKSLLRYHVFNVHSKKNFLAYKSKLLNLKPKKIKLITSTISMRFRCTYLWWELSQDASKLSYMMWCDFNYYLKFARAEIYYQFTFPVYFESREPRLHWKCIGKYIILYKYTCTQRTDETRDRPKGVHDEPLTSN